MYQKVRSVHLSTGLFCLAFLLMYGASGVQMAHRRWWPIRERVAERSVRLPAGLTDARVASRELAIRGELTAVRASADALSFRIVRPGAVNQVQYSASSGETKIRTTDSGFTGLLNRLHHVEGTWHEYPLLNAWSAVLGLVSLGLLVLGGTGLYLWFLNHSERWIGAVLLAAGGGLAALLIVSMRA
ncbi:MAG: PepSY-associated TM helix domain-containing protein [Acidobacteriia bacterium]|nr:PepSY-associated TM helix domain-containing protein [Terriglobia bacterium]